MKTSVLVVDDSSGDSQLAGEIIQTRLGWGVLYADNGHAAMDMLRRHSPQVILTDLNMPEMDGLALVEEVRRTRPLVPVVIMTAHGSEEAAVRALRCGAASYVPKKHLLTDLPDVLEQVHTVAQSEHRQQRLLESLTGIEVRYRVESDPTLVSALVARFQDYLVRLKVIDEGGKIRAGIAIEEALLNAIYHGNLEVSSDLRQEDDAAFHRLAEERRSISPYRERRVSVVGRFDHAAGEIVITDQGPGFDPSKLPDPRDPENLLKSSGRGIMLIRTFMDEVRYNTTGNEITLIKRAKSAAPGATD